MTELPTEPVQRLIGKYEQRISKLEDVNGKLCEEINRQEKVIEQQRKDYGELAQINHRLSERIANSGSGCEYCDNGVRGFDGQAVMISNHGWQKIHYCPNCGRKVKQ